MNAARAAIGDISTPARWGRLLSELDAAEYLSLSPTTLRTLGVPVRRIGRRVLYDRLDLDRWADRIGEQPIEAPDQARESADEEQRFFERRASRGGN